MHYFWQEGISNLKDFWACQGTWSPHPPPWQNLDNNTTTERFSGKCFGTTGCGLFSTSVGKKSKYKVCFILESSNGFWLWLEMRCMSPDDTYLIPMLCALSSQSCPPRTLLTGLSSISVGQGPWLFPSRASRLTLKKVDLESTSSHLSAAPPSFSWW